MSDFSTSSTHTTREPQPNIPATLKEREELRQDVALYVRRHELCAPLTVNELKQHAANLLEQYQWPSQSADFAAVLINNALWRDTVAAIPFKKRLLLMPKCLRAAETCPAECDEIGLLCQHCGECIIHDFKRQAEDLGYAVLIAEGSPIVMRMIETGQVEAVVGVSCLSTLERVFPYMEAGAVPGIAIPLLYDGCRNTAIDTDWLWEAVYDFSADPSIPRLDLDQQRQRVEAWFTPEALHSLLQVKGTHTESLALDWMARAGKRWRPFLTACTLAALATDKEVEESDIQRTAVAVECFHKASLIHDDIEDNGRQRYGQETMHAGHGIPVALNVGDLLIGWGYQLLADLTVPGDTRARLIRSAAHGHRVMCLGQGEELTWSRQPQVLSSPRVLEIFRQKTAPAFEVALTTGALLAGADDALLHGLHQYSEALGMAYQIRDDLDDYLATAEEQQHLLDRPSIVMALATEQAQGHVRDLLVRAWQEPAVRETEFARILTLFKDLGIELLVRDLMKGVKAQAIDTLMQLNNPVLKGLLRRVISRIFDDFDLMGCCNDSPTRHDSNHS
jgi:geranylgeranyl diphosphate synthase, type II